MSDKVGRLIVPPRLLTGFVYSVTADQRSTDWPTDLRDRLVSFIIFLSTFILTLYKAASDPTYSRPTVPQQAQG